MHPQRNEKAGVDVEARPHDHRMDCTVHDRRRGEDWTEPRSGVSQRKSFTPTLCDKDQESSALNSLDAESPIPAAAILDSVCGEQKH